MGLKQRGGGGKWLVVIPSVGSDKTPKLSGSQINHLNFTDRVDITNAFW
jgi:hypothetical protein